MSKPITNTADLQIIARTIGAAGGRAGTPKQHAARRANLAGVSRPRRKAPSRGDRILARVRTDLGALKPNPMPLRVRVCESTRELELYLAEPPPNPDRYGYDIRSALVARYALPMDFAVALYIAGGSVAGDTSRDGGEP